MNVLIIYYHEVVETGQGFSYQKIEVNKFEKQMRYLSERGYKSLFFSELSGQLPSKPIIVSFDDGFRSVYTNAVDIMAKYAIKGNVYLPTAFIGNDEKFMSWDMVGELQQSGQFEMQAHTHTHADIRRLNSSSMKKELMTSNQLFREYLGTVPKAFCMPFGVWDMKSIRLLRTTSQYQYILGSHYGRVEQNRLCKCIVPRIGITNDDSIKVFERKIKGFYDWKGPLQVLRLMSSNIKGQVIGKYEY